MSPRLPAKLRNSGLDSPDLREAFWRDALAGAPGVWRLACLVGGAACALATTSDAALLDADYLTLGYGLRGMLMVYFLTNIWLTYRYPDFVRRNWHLLTPSVIYLLGISMCVMDALSHSAAKLYMLGIIEVEFAAAAFLPLSNVSFIVAVAIISLLYPLTHLAIAPQPLAPDMLYNLSITLVIVGLLAIGAHAVIMSSKVRSFLQRQVIEQSEAKISKILNSITNSFFHLDSKWRFTYFNHEAEQLLGRMQHSQESLLQKNIWEVFPNLAADSLMHDEFQRALSENVPITFEEYYPLMDVYLEVHAYPAEEGISAYCTDVTDRRMAQDALRSSHQALEERVEARTRELRQLIGRLETIREDERADISREVHDELGQALTVLRLDVSWLHGQIDAADAAVRARAQQMLETVDDTLSTVRRIASDLRPAVLDDFGLSAALETLAESLNNSSSMAINWAIAPVTRDLDPGLSIAVYRIAQEALTNALRHSRGQSIFVRFQVDGAGDRMHLEVVDDGVGVKTAQGLDGTSGPFKRGIGLTSMQERAIQFDGLVSVDNAEGGQGTTVCLDVPIRLTEPVHQLEAQSA